MTTNPRLPSLFLSHGSPMLAVEQSPAGHFLDGLGDALPRPRAIVVASAHFTFDHSLLGGNPQPHTVHDFGGFPEPLYQLQYPAPGLPALAEDITARLIDAGMAAKVRPGHGLDHGVWVPLRRMYPEADIPVVQLSLIKGLDAEQHIRLGRCLAPLRAENVAIIGSGMSFHNLQAIFAGERADLRAASDRFDEWLRDVVSDPALTETQRAEALAHWQQAPYARFSHPREEHLLPLHVCYGAAAAPGQLLFNEPLMGHKVSGFAW